jgi:hypothetical protein
MVLFIGLYVTGIVYNSFAFYTSKIALNWFEVELKGEPL